MKKPKQTGANKDFDDMNDDMKPICKIYSNGNKIYFLNGILHREDGPAIEYSSGHKEWHVNGQSHREDGPAIEWSDGGKEWWKNGKRHRKDGPAVAYPDGTKIWYLEGVLMKIQNPKKEKTNWQQQGF